jgi:hypothetical protein
MIEFHRTLPRHKAASSGLWIVKPPRGPAILAQLRARTWRNGQLKYSPRRKQPVLSSWIDHSRAEANEGNGPLRSGRSQRNYDRQKCMTRLLVPEMRNSSTLWGYRYGLPPLVLSHGHFAFVVSASSYRPARGLPDKVSWLP